MKQSNQLDTNDLIEIIDEAAIYTAVISQGKLCLVNRSFAHLLGYSKTQLENKEVGFIMPHDEVTSLLQNIDSVKKGQRLPIDNVEFIKKGGHRITCNISLKKINFDSRSATLIVITNVNREKEPASDQNEDNFFQIVLENSSDVVAIVNADGSIQYGNSSLASFLGYSKDEVLGKSSFNFIHEDDLHQAANAFEQLMINPDANIQAELKVQHKDGSWHTMEISGKNMLDNPSVNGILANFRDITDRRQAQNALEQSEKKLRTYLESSPDAIYINNAQGVFLYGNRVAEELIGYSREELIGKSFFDVNIVSLDCLSKVAHILNSNKAGQPTYADEFELVKKDGSRIVAEISTYPICSGDDMEIICVARDITRRKKIEEARKEAEKRYRAMFDNRIQMVYIHDELGRFLDANDYAIETMGLSREDIRSKSFVDFVHPDDLPKAFEIITDIMAKGYMDHPAEVRIITPSGEIMWIDTYCIPLEISENHYIGIGIVHDITERKNAEEALRESEQNFRMIFELSPEAIVVLDEKGYIVDLNQKLFEWIGYEPEEAIGKNLIELPFLPEESKIKAIENFMRRMGGEEIGPYELTFIAKNGEERIGLITATSIQTKKDDGTQATYDLIVVSNITERKQSEKILRYRTKQIVALQDVTTYMQSTLELNEVLQRISEAVVINMGFHVSMIFLADETGSNHCGTVYYPNNEESVQLVFGKYNLDDMGAKSVSDIERVLNLKLTQLKVPIQKGYSYVVDNCIEGKETIVHSLYEIAGPLIPKEACDEIQRLLAAKTIVDVPFYAKDKLVGSLIAFTYREEIDEEDLESLRLLASHAGIAIENAKLNENLERMVEERTKQLQAVNKELESFAYSVSHDLRAPLRSIDGFSHILIEDYADRLDQEGKDYLERVRSASQRMAQLIEAILQLSRLTRGELSTKMVNLSEIIELIAYDLQKDQPERNVEFTIQPNLYVEGDERLLGAAMENLIGNAWKFTGKKDKAKIEFGRVNSGDRPVYFVKDNGAGFDMNYAKNLFGAFQRLHTKTEFDGTGIGLATVQRIINRHGGDVWAEGAVDQGATFYFTM